MIYRHLLWCSAVCAGVLLAGCVCESELAWCQIEMPVTSFPEAELDRIESLAATAVKANRNGQEYSSDKLQVFQTEYPERIFVASVSFWQRGVSHSGASNAEILIAGQIDDRFIVDVLDNTDALGALELWKAPRGDWYVLFAEFTGPIYSASASSELVVYAVDPQEAIARRLVSIHGPEESLANRTFSWDVHNNGSLTATVTVEVDDPNDPKRGIEAYSTESHQVIILEETPSMIQLRMDP